MRYLTLLILIFVAPSHAKANDYTLMIGDWESSSEEVITFRSDGQMLTNHEPASLTTWKVVKGVLFIGDKPQNNLNLPSAPSTTSGEKKIRGGVTKTVKVEALAKLEMKTKNQWVTVRLLS